MTHEEWRGDVGLIKMLLKKSGLEETADEGELKTIMREIILCRYVEMMTVDETLTHLSIECNVDISIAKYYRVLNKTIKLLEKWA